MAGRDLGELGVVRPANEDTFGWFGNRIRAGTVTGIRLMDFLERARSVREEDQEEALTFVKDFLQSLVHEDDWDTFWHAAIDNHQEVEDLMAVVKAIVEGGTGRPTRRRSASQAGRRSTAAKSKGGSSSAVVLRMERAGRPDLAMAVQTAQRGRSRTG